MRTLTLGVLIVSGGTLAALPFRRYQVIQDASAVPTQVTGPSQSALRSNPPEDSGSEIQQLPSIAEVETLMDLSPEAPSFGNVGRPAPRRHVDIPLTFDDLAVPIDQPKPVQDRFNATAAVQQRQPADSINGLVMPSIESLPPMQQQEFQRVREATLPASKQTGATAAGRLASTPSSSGASLLDSTPHFSNPNLSNSTASPQEDRERFWIRQPD